MYFRPNAEFAVPGTSYAPRSQLLKLKGSIDVCTRIRDIFDYNQSAPFQISLSTISDWFLTGLTSYDSLANGVQTDKFWYGYFKPLLGFSAYAKIFQTYVINGVKLDLQFTLKDSQFLRSAPNGPILQNPTQAPTPMVVRSFAPLTQTLFPVDALEVLAMPYGKCFPMSTNALASDSVYINLNRVFGYTVQDYDRFHRQWPDVISDVDPNAQAVYQMYFFVPSIATDANSATLPENHFFLSVKGTVTYYFSAESVYAVYPPVAGPARIDDSVLRSRSRPSAASAAHPDAPTQPATSNNESNDDPQHNNESNDDNSPSSSPLLASTTGFKRRLKLTEL